MKSDKTHRIWHCTVAVRLHLRLLTRLPNLRWEWDEWGSKQPNEQNILGASITFALFSSFSNGEAAN